MDEAGFFRICMIILQEFRRTIKRRRRNTSGGFPFVRSVKAAVRHVPRWRLLRGDAGSDCTAGLPGEKGDRKETPHSGSCENNGSPEKKVF